MDDKQVNNTNMPFEHNQPDVTIIDNAIVDLQFGQMDLSDARDLLEDCFAELDREIERFELAGAQGDRSGCLAALQGLRGFAADYGATALSNELAITRQALVVRDYGLLGESKSRFSEILRDTRTALLIRLARYAAVQPKL